MLTAGEIASLRDASEELTAPIIAYLLRDLAERIAAAGEFTATAQYETWKLQQLGVSQKEIKKELQKLLKSTNADIERLMTQSAQAGYSFDLKMLPTAEAISFADNAAVQQIVAAAVALAQDDLTNITQTLGMIDPYGNAQPLQTAYRQCMDYAFMQVSTGAADYNTAIRAATKNLADKGVYVIDYESGVHTTLEAAVRRNIMGGLGLMQEEISKRNHDDMGADGWEIDAHSNSAPDHEPIQGKQYPDAEYEALNNSLVRRIGTLNCGHSAYPIIMGISSPQYSAEQLEAMRTANAEGITYNGRHYTGYEATQHQRALERAIRKQKRRILIDEATGDAEKLKTDQIKLQTLRQEYNGFSKAAKLRTQTERAEVAGFGHKQANAADKAARGHYKTWSKSIGVDSSIKNLAEYYEVKYNDIPRYELLQNYAADVKSGWISPLAGFGGYEALHNQIQSEIVGKRAINGILISGQSRHFIQRVVGTMIDPQKFKNNLQIVRRSGVEITDIKDALFSESSVVNVTLRNNGKTSVKFIGENCMVTLNPETGILIQVNPKKVKTNVENE